MALSSSRKTVLVAAAAGFLGSHIVLGAQRLIEMARGGRCMIVQASTSEVYGDPTVHPQPESYWGNVNPIGPRACYDEGKRGAETLLSDARRSWGVDARIVRIFNTYGPRMAISDGRVVSNFVVQALTGKALTLFGDGSQSRSFCYVDDLIEGFVRVARLPSLDAPLNLGNPRELSMLELAHQILALTGSRSTLVFSPLPADDPKQRRPDIGRARSLIAFEPRTVLRDGLAQTIADFAPTLRRACRARDARDRTERARPVRRATGARRRVAEPDSRRRRGSEVGKTGGALDTPC